MGIPLDQRQREFVYERKKVLQPFGSLLVGGKTLSSPIGCRARERSRGVVSRARGRKRSPRRRRPVTQTETARF